MSIKCHFLYAVAYIVNDNWLICETKTVVSSGTKQIVCCTYTSSNSVAILPVLCSGRCILDGTTITKLSFTDTNSGLAELEPRRVRCGGAIKQVYQSRLHFLSVT